MNQQQQLTPDDPERETEEHFRRTREIFHNHILENLREDLADSYAQLFPPDLELSKDISPKVERLISYLVYAISLHLDDFTGWEEEDELVQEFDMLFTG